MKPLTIMKLCMYGISSKPIFNGLSAKAFIESIVLSESNLIKVDTKIDV